MSPKLRPRSIVLPLAPVMALATLAADAAAGTIRVRNVGATLPESRPVVLNDGRAIEDPYGFIEVGVFETFGPAEITEVDRDTVSDLNSDWDRFGSRAEFGHLGFPGLIDHEFIDNGSIPAGSVGKEIYILVSNGTSVSRSDQLLLIKTNQTMPADAADVDLEFDLSTMNFGFGTAVSLGVLGPEADIESGGLVIAGLESFRMARLVNPTQRLPAACAGPQPVGEPIIIGPELVGGSPRLPCIASDAAGRVVVAWTDSSQFAGSKCWFARFDADGAPIGAPSELDADTIGQFGATVACAPDGRFVIAWLAVDTGGGGFEIWLRRFGADGVALAPAQPLGDPHAQTFLFEDQTDGRPLARTLTVAMAPDGRFAIGSQRLDGMSAVIDIFAADGVLQATHDIRAAASRAYVGMDASGNTVAGVEDLTAFGSGRMTLHGFDAAGAETFSVALGGSTSGDVAGFESYLAVLPDGRFGASANFSGGGAPQERRCAWFTPDGFVDTSILRRQKEILQGQDRLAAGPSGMPYLYLHYDSAAEAVRLDAFDAQQNALFTGQPLFAGNGGEMARLKTAPRLDGLWIVHLSPGGASLTLRPFGARALPEFHHPLNARSESEGDFATVATGAADGSYLVAWIKGEEALRVRGIIPTNQAAAYARRFDADGRPLGDEFRLSEQLANSYWRPAVAMHGDGSFTAAWEQDDPDRFNGDRFIGARRFAADGTPLGPEVEVGIPSTNDLGEVDVAALPGGSSVVVWKGEDRKSVMARILDATGSPVGAPIVVAVSLETIEEPVVGADASGRWAVCWWQFSSNVGKGGGPGTDPAIIRLQQFDAAHSPFGAADALPVGQGAFDLPRLAVQAGGEFVVGFMEDSARFRCAGGTLGVLGVGVVRTATPTAVPQELRGVSLDDQLRVTFLFDSDAFNALEAARFDLSVFPLGAPEEMRIAQQASGSADLGGLPDGRLASAWGSTQDMYTRVFDFSSNFPEVGVEEFLVNAATAGEQRRPRAAVAPDGQCAVVWEEPSNGSATFIRATFYGTDGSVLAQDVPVASATDALGSVAVPDVACNGTHYLVVFRLLDSTGTAKRVMLSRFDLSGAQVGIAQELALIGGGVSLEPPFIDAEPASGEFAVGYLTRSLGASLNITAYEADATGILARSLAVPWSRTVPSISMKGETALLASNISGLEDSTDLMKFSWETGGGAGLVLTPMAGPPGSKPDVVLLDGERFYLARQVANAGSGKEDLHFGCYDLRSGRPLGTDLVFASSSRDHLTPRIAADGAGRCLLAWEHAFTSSSEIFHVLLDGAGFSATGEFDDQRLNDFVSGALLQAPALAMNAAGDGIAAWQTDQVDAVDIMARRLTGLRPPVDPYEQWAEGFGDPSVLDPNGDSDGDGECNFKEYVADTDPTDPRSKHPVEVVYFPTGGIGGNPSLRISYRIRNDDPGLRAIPEASVDLSDWFGTSGPTGDGPGPGDTTDVNEGATLPAGSTEGFGRVRFTR